MGMQESLRALADPTRREILNLLKKGRLPAGEIAEHFDISTAAVSRHLAVLREAGLVFDEREGKFVYYSLNTSVLEEILLWLTDLKGDAAKGNVCPDCGHCNAEGVRYCQRCGHFIKPKWTLQNEVRAWRPQGLAGTGLKDASIAPLYTVPVSDTSLAGGAAAVEPSACKVEPLPDGSWYCPDCGTLNSSAAAFCKNCGKIR